MGTTDRTRMGEGSSAHDNDELVMKYISAPLVHSDSVARCYYDVTSSSSPIFSSYAYR